MEAFEALYEMWPNKGQKAQTKLAYDYVSKKFNYSPNDYVKAAQVWMDRASDFQKDKQLLANWLRDEKFIVALNEIAASGGLSNCLQSIQMYRDAAVVVMGEWNRLRRGWWAKVEDIKGRSIFVEDALRNQFFQSNWSKALQRAHRIFEYAERDSIGNCKLRPTIEWFCSIEDNTVARILEGYWGNPAPKTEIKRYPKTDLAEKDKPVLSMMLAITKQNIEYNIQQDVADRWKVLITKEEVRMMDGNTIAYTKPLPTTQSQLIFLYQDMVDEAKLNNGDAPKVEELGFA